MRPLAAALALAASGCLPALETPPPNAPPAQVAACRQDARLHNAGIFTGTGLAGSGAILGFTAAEIDNGPRKAYVAVDITGAAVTGLAVVDIIVTAVEARKYNDDGCGALTGPLPDSTKK